jgi:hypothetical protein
MVAQHFPSKQHLEYSKKYGHALPTSTSAYIPSTDAPHDDEFVSRHPF